MNRRARAFSLVEVLVVIGLIAVLIGILIPIVSRARSSAASTACKNNLRSIGQACLNRAAENDGYVGLAGLIDNEGDPHHDLAPKLLDSSRRRYQYLRFDPHDTFENLKALPLILAEHMSRDGKSGDHEQAIVLARRSSANFLSVFQCPGADDSRRPRATHRYVRGVAGIYPISIDYGFNAGVFGFHHAANSTSRRARGKFPVPHADATILACDIVADNPGVMAAFTPAVPGTSRLTLADALNGSPELVAPGARPDVARHRDGVNVLFADGHVGAVVSADLGGCLLCR